MNFVSFTRPLAYIAACGVIALGLATAPQAGAASLSGDLVPAEDGGGIISLPGVYDFFAEFDEFSDQGSVGTYTFQFRNDTASSMVLTFLSGTVTQTPSRFFGDGDGGPGVQVDFGSGANTATIASTPGQDGFGPWTETLAATETIWLVIDWFAVTNTATASAGGDGPIIDFLVEASVVPLPASFVLFLTGLAGIGFLGRYKAKRRVPELA